MLILQISFMNVGYGEAILITCGEGGKEPFVMLIDGGSSEADEFEGYPYRVSAAEYLTRAGVKRIDLMVNTHIHEDHTCGLLPLVPGFSVGTFLTNLLPGRDFKALPDSLADNPSAGKFLKALNDSLTMARMLQADNVAISAVSGVLYLSPCAGLELELYGPDSKEIAAYAKDMLSLYEYGDPAEKRTLFKALDARMNNLSILLRLRYKGRAVLFAGDTNRDGYAQLMKAPGLLRADVFKLGHHGQSDSITEDILAAVDPSIAVICAASDCRYDSMHPDILQMLQAYGAARQKKLDILLTDTPDLPPYTDGMPPHRVTQVEIREDGALCWRYA